METFVTAARNNTDANINSILDETPPTPVGATDSEFENTIDKEDTLFEQCVERNKKYTALLTSCITIYEEKAKQKASYKRWFFTAVLAVLMVIVLGGSYIIYRISCRSIINAGAITLIASSVVSIVSSIIVLPQIIAKHLFPESEDTLVVDILKNMQINDKGIRSDKNGKNN